MVQSQSGDGWTVEITDGVIVWEFLPGMKLSAFRDEAYPIFEELLETHEFDGMVTDVRLDDPFTGDTFEIWEQSAQHAEQAGVERWGVVANGIKAISLRGKINTGGLDILTTEDRSEAIEWASG